MYSEERISDETRLSDLIAQAKAGGAIVHMYDYDHTAIAVKNGRGAIYLQEVYRAERDGYIGLRTITEQYLAEWLSGKD